MAAQVRPALIALALALAAGPAVAGCGGGSSPSGSAAAGRATAAGATGGAAPSTTTAGGSGAGTNGGAGANGGPATVDATLSGLVAGHLDNPVKGPKYTCGTDTYPDLFALNDVEGTVGGSPYRLHIDINNFTGSGKQTGNVAIELDPGTDIANSYSNTTGYPTVVMTDKQSGTFEADLRQGLAISGPAVHVQGSFRC